MKDIHNHILFGIDDGSDNLEESIKIIRNAVENGYTDLILTPHFRKKQGYTCNNKDKKMYFEQLQNELFKNDITINLYLGNEITVDEYFFHYLESGEIMTLCNSRYFLLELPFTGAFKGLTNLIKKLKSMGYVPIIAHPERCCGYKIDDYIKMIKDGALLQADSGSINGKYGDKVKIRIETMLKRHMIHFIGSDIHHDMGTSYDRINRTFEKIVSLTKNEQMAKELTDDNIAKVIKNEEIEAYPLCKIKYRLKVFNL